MYLLAVARRPTKKSSKEQMWAYFRAEIDRNSQGVGAGKKVLPGDVLELGRNDNGCSTRHETTHNWQTQEVDDPAHAEETDGELQSCKKKTGTGGSE